MSKQWIGIDISKDTLSIALQTESQWVGRKVPEKRKYHPPDRENRTRSYEDKQGVKRYMTEVVGDELIMLDKKED